MTPSEAVLTAPPAVPAGAAVAALPPGPRLPPLLQTAGFVLGGRRWLEFCRRRYGPAVFMRTVFDDGFVMVFDPGLVRELFQGPHLQLNAGEANALLAPLLGARSVLVLDGVEHLAHRRLMLPPFHGRRLEGYEDTIAQATDAEIDRWPVQSPFRLLSTLQSVTLTVVIRAVFGTLDTATETALRDRIRAMIDPVTQPRGMLSLFLAPRLGIDRGRRRFLAAQAELDELLSAEIARRREPGFASTDDVLSGLVAARDGDGHGLSDEEIRDELVTLLVAGHETTATALAWTFDLVLRRPDVLTRIRAREAGYLDAVIKEALRCRTVIPGVGRVVRGAPFALGPWRIPEGVEINPSIRVIHERRDLYPHPRRFLPERHLGPDAPDTYTWLPFGGGTRRCLGASFAQMEMRVIIERVLERCELTPIARRPDRPVFRAITLAPKHGVRVIQRQAPRPRAPR